MPASNSNDDIRARDIIQADAAVIAGMLILLTISSFSPFEFPNRSMFVSLTIPAIVLFSISAIFILNKRLVLGKRLAKAGFSWLIGFMVFLMAINIINVTSSNIWQDPAFEKIASSNISTGTK
jgi:hypothetical protein